MTESGTMSGPLGIAIEPEAHRRPAIAASIEAAGATVTDLGLADALVWTAWSDPAGLRSALDRAPGVRWVQLSTAGVDAIAPAFDDDHVWTCAKGAFSAPIAEHALALMLAGLRDLHRFTTSGTYGAPSGRNLLGARVTIVGGGGIARALIELLGPFGATVTVVRRTVVPMDGVADVVDTTGLDDAVSGADVVVLALALTPETERIIGAPQLAAMGPDCWLVNVARGRHIDTPALVEALRSRRLGGAALDAHEQEPLPDDHPLRSVPNCIITPHTACTSEMGDVRFAGRVAENVTRWRAGEPLLGLVDTANGY